MVPFLLAEPMYCGHGWFGASPSSADPDGNMGGRDSSGWTRPTPKGSRNTRRSMTAIPLASQNDRDGPFIRKSGPREVVMGLV